MAGSSTHAGRVKAPADPSPPCLCHRTDAAAAATSPAHAPRLPGCSGLFPPYFEDMHRFLSAFYHPPQQDGCCSSSTNDEDMAAVTWPAVSYILTWLPRLVRLPTPALALLLPYILQARLS